jgi:putative hydrolases of HD superfamily
MSKEKLFESPEFVLAEVEKMRTLYGLKKEIRYDQKRIHEAHTESVAEHVYALHCLVDYFLILENPEGDWDKLRIHQMVQYHDIDEIETGDVLGYLKTEVEKENERAAAETVIKNLPDILQPIIRDVLDEYEQQQTPESQFAKAIDKVEPLFHLYDEEGRDTMHRNMTTRGKSDSIKYPYVNNFPFIKRFVEVLSEKYVDENHFYPES